MVNRKAEGGGVKKSGQGCDSQASLKTRFLEACSAGWTGEVAREYSPHK